MLPESVFFRYFFAQCNIKDISPHSNESQKSFNLKTAVLTTAGTANTAKNNGFKLFLRLTRWVIEQFRASP
jgi:hypothetical protein